MGYKEEKTPVPPKRCDSGGKTERQKSLIVNFVLLLSGIAMSLSGLMLQCHYHLQKNPAESLVLGLDRPGWNAVHVWTSVAFLMVVVFHVWVHRKWYVQILKRGLYSKHRQTLLLTFLMLVAAAAGFAPWLIGCFGGSPAVRSVFIEIHDKIALLFLAVAIGHAVKRRTWYSNALRRKKRPD